MKTFLRLEQLENRLVPSTIQVNPAPHALQNAINAAVPGDTLLLAHGTYVEDVKITKSLTIIGQPDAAHQNPFIVGAGGSGNLEAIVEVAAGVENVSLSHVAIGDSHGSRPIQVGLLVDPGAGNFSFSFSVIRKIRDPNAAIGDAATVGFKAQPGSHDLVISHVAFYNLDDPIGTAGDYAYGVWLQGVRNASLDHVYVKDVGDLGFFVNDGSSNILQNYCAVSELQGATPVGFYIQNAADTLSGCKVYGLTGTSIGLKLEGSADVTMLFGAIEDNYVGIATYDFTGTFTQTSVIIDGNTIPLLQV